MSRLGQGLRRRTAGLVKHPRHFAQLILPALLILSGWLALALNFWTLGIILISAALVVFPALIWMRLRRMQARTDRGMRMVANRPIAVVPAVASTSNEAPPGSHEPSPEPTPLPALDHGVVAGLPAGLALALDAAAPTSSGGAVLVVPNSLREVSTAWVEGTFPGRWRVCDEDAGRLRSHAAGTQAVIILDSPENPTYAGVLDQSFFWWLPQNARLFLISRDGVAFASRLATQHDVDLALTPHAFGSFQAAVMRKKGNLHE